MKTAIYIEDGIVQLVVTPESDFEKNALSTFYEKPLAAKIMSGSFYDCRGGWIRQSTISRTIAFDDRGTEKSLILRCDLQDT